MSEFQNVFKRYELKYLISTEQRRNLEEAMAGRMDPDPHGENSIRSLYFDTPDFRIIRRSLEKPVYKEKLRLRSYGSAECGKAVFLELKKKYKGVVYKRRISLPEKDASQFLCGEAQLPVSSQIGDEIAYFLSSNRGLGPSVHLSYDRSALYAKDDRNLRVTFDTNILWRNTELSLMSLPHGEPLLKEGQVLMELKTASSLPLWLARLLSENRLYTSSFSKYGSAYRSLLHQHSIVRCPRCLTESLPVCLQAEQRPA